MFQFLTQVEFSRSMAAILEMPQYVAYQKNVAYAFIQLSEKSHSFNILSKIVCLAALLSKQNKTIMIKLRVQVEKCSESF